MSPPQLRRGGRGGADFNYNLVFLFFKILYTKYIVNKQKYLRFIL
jgi:hypothetical protein